MSSKTHSNFQPIKLSMYAYVWCPDSVLHKLLYVLACETFVLSTPNMVFRFRAIEMMNFGERRGEQKPGNDRSSSLKLWLMSCKPRRKRGGEARGKHSKEGQDAAAGTHHLTVSAMDYCVICQHADDDDDNLHMHVVSSVCFDVICVVRSKKHNTSVTACVTAVILPSCHPAESFFVLLCLPPFR